MSRITLRLGLALVFLIATVILLRRVAAAEVSMTLLASGGALAIRALAVAAVAMLMRLASVLLIPGFVLGEIALWAWPRIRRTSSTARTAGPAQTEAAP